MKIQSVAILVGILIAITVAVFKVINIYYDKNSDVETSGKVSYKLQWELCWMGDKKFALGTNQWKSTGMCGDVIKIEFDKAGEVLSMTVRHNPSGWITEFFKEASSEKGIWTTATDRGWWTLTKISNGNFEGKCRGNEKEDKVRQLILSLKK